MSAASFSIQSFSWCSHTGLRCVSKRQAAVGALVFRGGSLNAISHCDFMSWCFYYKSSVLCYCIILPFAPCADGWHCSCSARFHFMRIQMHSKKTCGRDLHFLGSQGFVSVWPASIQFTIHFTTVNRKTGSMSVPGFADGNVSQTSPNWHGVIVSFTQRWKSARPVCGLLATAAPC